MGLRVVPILSHRLAWLGCQAHLAKDSGNNPPILKASTRCANTVRGKLAQWKSKDIRLRQILQDLLAPLLVTILPHNELRLLAKIRSVPSVKDCTPRFAWYGAFIRMQDTDVSLNYM